MRIGIIAILFMYLSAAGAAGAEDARKVKAVQFRGLKLLSKYDIIRGVRLKAVENGIVIDMESLGTALANNHFIKSYQVEEIGGNLVVSVREKSPSHIVVVAKGGIASIYELDADNTIISKNDVHASNLPILYITDREINSDAIQGGVKRLFEVLARVKIKNVRIYRELSEIYFMGEKIRVILRGRKTEFVLAPGENEFKKLQYITGYLDRAKKNPDEIIISDNAAIMRRIAGDAINR